MYKVSVIIPIYNVEKYLRECLDSAVGQTLKDIEVICIDDGSPDASAQIVAEYMERYDNIKLIRQENRGLSCARNAGLDIATGEYVQFLDSDDMLDRQAMESLYEVAKREKLDVLYFNRRVWYDNDAVRKAHEDKFSSSIRTDDYSGLCTGQTMFAKLRKDHQYLTSACYQLLRRDFLTEQHIRFFPGILHEDNLFTFQCSMTARRVNYVTDEYYLRRVRADSIMTSPSTIRNVEGYLVCYYEALAFLHDIPVQEDAAEFVQQYLYGSLYGNACQIWAGLQIDEQSKAFSCRNIGAEQLLLTIKRSVQNATRHNTLRQEKEQLAEKLKARQKQLTALKARIKKFEEENRKLKERGIRGFFRTVRAKGFLYALRQVWKNGCDDLTDLLIALSRGRVRYFFTLAKKQGWKYAARAAFVKLRMKRGGKAPLVSFVLPVYNVAPYLEQSMDCLLCQTLKHIEIICVDDGSTDNSLQILRRYEEKDSRVRVFTQKNQFAGAARNHGLSKARGEYVCFLDPDDFYEKTLAEDTYYAAKTADADAVIYDARYYDNVTKEFREADWLFNRNCVPEKEPFCRPDTLLQISTPCPWTKLFRRQFVVEEGLQFQSLRNANDIFFTYGAMALAKRIVTVNKKLVNYRGNVSTGLQATKGSDPLCFYRALQALHDLLQERGLLEQLRKSYVNAALSVSLNNWRTQKDPQIQQVIETALREYIFRDLELTGYSKDYYYNAKYYEEMQQILGNTTEISHIM